MINWINKKFNELSNLELYNYLALRSEVFIVEQNCPYQDLDGNDEIAIHILGIDNKSIVACARIFAPGDCYEEACIGRVISKGTHRGTGLGHELMQQAIALVTKLYGNVPIKIGAQAYLEKFYQSHGFITVSDIYLEDNIPHIKMLRESR